MPAAPDPLRSERLIVFWRLAFCAATLTVTTMSLLPGDALPTMPDISDKLQHVLAYAGLAVLAGFGWRWGGSLSTVIAGVVLLGGMIELAQNAVPGRYGEWADFAANTAGVAAGVVLFQLRAAGSRAD